MYLHLILVLYKYGYSYFNKKAVDTIGLMDDLTDEYITDEYGNILLGGIYG